MDILLTERALSQRLDISTRTLERYRRSGEGPPFIRIGVRCVRYRLADVEQWEEDNTHAHHASEYATQT